MARTKKGEAISPQRRTVEELTRLTDLLAEAETKQDLALWRRAKAVTGYLDGRRVIELCKELDVARSAINGWLQWFNAAGAEGLRTVKHLGPTPRLTMEQFDEMIATIEGGPQLAGFSTGMWTGPMIGDLIARRYGVRYHNHYIPRLLHEMGFSVQRPRKRLARADLEAQATWIRERFPAIKKKADRCRGIVAFEDEASFWLDGTLHQTWSRVGHQPRVDTFGQRKTAHVFGAVTLDEAEFNFRFAPVFNGHTFHQFLAQLVRRYAPRKLFLIIDNGPCHNLDDEGKQWLAENSHLIQLHRLPPYSPEFNPTEGVWKVTRKLTTHNRFYRTTDERDFALRRTFGQFQRKPALIAAHLERFQ